MKRPNRKSSNRKKMRLGVLALYVGMAAVGLAAWCLIIFGFIAWLG